MLKVQFRDKLEEPDFFAHERTPSGTVIIPVGTERRLILRTYSGWVNLVDPEATWGRSSSFHGREVNVTVVVEG